MLLTCFILLPAYYTYISCLCLLASQSDPKLKISKTEFGAFHHSTLNCIWSDWLCRFMSSTFSMGVELAPERKYFFWHCDACAVPNWWDNAHRSRSTRSAWCPCEWSYELSGWSNPQNSCRICHICAVVHWCAGILCAIEDRQSAENLFHSSCTNNCKHLYASPCDYSEYTYSINPFRIYRICNTVIVHNSIARGYPNTIYLRSWYLKIERQCI